MIPEILDSKLLAVDPTIMLAFSEAALGCLVCLKSLVTDSKNRIFIKYLL